MARSDLIVKLVRAGATGDKQLLKSTVEALTADERTKSHHILADRIERAYTSVPVAPSLTSAATIIPASGKDAILELTPKISLDDLLLPLPAHQAARQLIEEHTRADVLRAHGYEPRHRVLLSGPPGNGKTSYAEAVAESLGLPFYVVRYDALVGSFLGETNTRLRSLFDYVRTRPSVLFFDEFDSVAKERGDTHETGEIKRVVSFLLMQLDQLPSYIVVMAATNHAELLDRAVWRRFQMRLSFPRPDKKEVEAYLDRQFSMWPERPRLSLPTISKRLAVDSYAEALDFCQNVRRRQILGLGAIGVDSALEDELTLWEQRERPEVIDGDRTAEAVVTADSRGRSSS